jgi:hypothetical protein
MFSGFNPRLSIRNFYQEIAFILLNLVIKTLAFASPHKSLGMKSKVCGKGINYRKPIEKRRVWHFGQKYAIFKSKSMNKEFHQSNENRANSFLPSI